MKYEVKSGNDWITCKKSIVTEKGWLHYELKDGTIGLAPPSKYRKKGESIGRTKPKTKEQM